jgi:hypothetical protein
MPCGRAVDEPDISLIKLVPIIKVHTNFILHPQSYPYPRLPRSSAVDILTHKLQNDAGLRISCSDFVHEHEQCRPSQCVCTEPTFACRGTVTKYIQVDDNSSTDLDSVNTVSTVNELQRILSGGSAKQSKRAIQASSEPVPPQAAEKLGSCSEGPSRSQHCLSSLSLFRRIASSFFPRPFGGHTAPHLKPCAKSKTVL